MREHVEEFMKAMTILSEVYDRPLSRAALLIYYRLLEKYPWEKVKAALETVLKTCRFFPRPAEIISLIEGRDEEAEILSAWKELLKEIREKGSWSENPFRERKDERSRRIAEIVEVLGGWKACCEWEEKDYPQLLGVFTRIYRALERAERKKAVMEAASKEMIFAEEEKDGGDYLEGCDKQECVGRSCKALPQPRNGGKDKRNSGNAGRSVQEDFQKDCP